MSVNNTEAPPDQNSTSSTSKKLNREFERLKTFPLNWEHGCSKRSLAEQGLYYEDDGVICAFCDHKNASNLSGDLQKVHSINCDFANGKQTQNIPLGNLHDTSFRVEQHRLITFLTVNWTAPVDPHDLAKWGFYYTGSADNCKCPFCRLEIRGWEPGDRGLSEHQRWNPQCRFITGHSVGNIPLGQENSETGTNVTSCANLGTQLGAVTLRDAKHPRYASTYARLASYDLWPMSISQRPEELVEAGLFYTGRGDRVICFHCGGGLKDWGLNDDPWEEHARWFSECSYVRQMKSKSLIESYSKKRKKNSEIEGKTGATQTTALYPSDALNLVTLGLINGKKYLFVDQDGSWFDASYFCNVHGMDLAVIETDKENDLIKEHIASLGKTSTLFWVGAHRLGRASYHWINGASMIFSDWGPGQPASPGDNCMAISNNSWLDYACNDPETFWRTAFVCEERDAT